MKNLAGLIVGILILSGCATTAKQSDLACEGKDWGPLVKPLPNPVGKYGVSTSIRMAVATLIRVLWTPI